MASDKPREKRLAEAFLAGVRKHGDSGVRSHKCVAEADVAVMVGVKSRETFRANRDAGRSVIMVDKGYSRHRLPGEKDWEYWRVSVDAHHPTSHIMDFRDTRRVAKMGVGLKPWRTWGKHIIIAGSSAKYHDFYNLPHPTEYAEQLVERIREMTDRPIMYRPKPSWKEAKPIRGTLWSGNDQHIDRALIGAWALVTHGSNACFEAVCAGVPCVVLGNAVARPISSASLDSVESPRLAPEAERRRWLCGLSYCQWTMDEFASGEAWATIRPQIGQ